MNLSFLPPFYIECEINVVLHFILFFFNFQLCPDWQIDYETYEWRKLDPDSEETKKLFSNYFSWTGTDKDGRPFNQGKIFK